jgi:hypothetical protein
LTSTYPEVFLTPEGNPRYTLKVRISHSAILASCL